jgi:parallel beta-helix repeat protein
MTAIRPLTCTVVALVAGLSLALSGCSGSAVSTSAAGVIGVTCHDEASDAASIQSAIDASGPGTVIQIGGGTCLITQGLVLAGNRTYAGAATTGTVLKQAGPMGYVLASSDYTGNSTTTGDPLQIRDLTVDCDGTGDTDGIVILNWQADVEQVDVHGCGGSGIVDTSVPHDGTPITNTSVNSRFENNFISDSGRYGFAVIDPVNSVTDGFFTDNQVADSGADGIYLQNAEGWNVTGNHLYGDAGNGIAAERLYGTTIAGNYIEDFGSGRQSGTWYGISGTAQDGPGSVILGNKVFNGGERSGAGYVYIAVTAANSGTGHLSVSANVVQTVAAADQAFYFNGSPYRLVVASAANQVSGPGEARAIGGGVTITPGT